MPKLMIDIENEEINKAIEIDQATKGIGTKQNMIITALAEHYKIKNFKIKDIKIKVKNERSSNK